MKRGISIVLAVLAAAAALLVLFVEPGHPEAESSMDIENGVLVKYAISDGMTQVTIPSTVTEIGAGAFREDTTLETIDIPGSVKKIGNNAFYGCESLKNVKLQDGLEVIGDNAFAMCSTLSTFAVPSTVTEIGNGAFAGDVALNHFYLDQNNAYFFLNENVLYNLNSTRLVQYIPGRQDEDFVMPFSVSVVEPYAFWGSEHMKTAYVSNQVTEIESYTFCNAAGLEAAYIPNSVTLINISAFRDCRNLKYVAIESEDCTVLEGAFKGCPEGLVIEYGVDKTAFRTKASGFAVKKTTSGNLVVSGNEAKQLNKDTDDEEQEEDETDGTKASVVNTTWGVKSSYTPVDRENPKGLIGAGKIAAGSAFIIPTDGYYEDESTTEEVSGNTVSPDNVSENVVSEHSASFEVLDDSSVSGQ
ncbi:MAG: leucine-rich repeat domain-containing protein [Lachnospiraceae bacterium]|nr:leucine-rich repeat domain-containing protein [Lachnospiraceae bacterium]